MNTRPNARTTVLAALPAALLVAIAAGDAAAHGAVQEPDSRALACHAIGGHWGDGPMSNAACEAARVKSGPATFDNWNGVRVPDTTVDGVHGRHRALIPDGQLCSAGNRGGDFSGLDLARTDWPSTQLTSGAEKNLRYQVSAPHAPSHYEFYITKDGYDPAKPLTWSDLEDVPFAVSNAATSQAGLKDMAVRLPGKKGKHLIYTIWQRHQPDSGEAFYSCSDVTFD